MDPTKQDRTQDLDRLLLLYSIITSINTWSIPIEIHPLIALFFYPHLSLHLTDKRRYVCYARGARNSFVCLLVHRVVGYFWQTSFTFSKVNLVPNVRFDDFYPPGVCKTHALMQFATYWYCQLSDNTNIIAVGRR